MNNIWVEVKDDRSGALWCPVLSSPAVEIRFPSLVLLIVHDLAKLFLQRSSTHETAVDVSLGK